MDQNCSNLPTDCLQAIGGPMSSRVRLTNPRVESFACPEGKSQAFLWDSVAPSLAVRSTPSGRKTFVFEGRFDGKTVRINLGETASLTIEGARERATEAKNLVDRGIDPRLEKKRKIDSEHQERQERKRQDITLGEVWGKYCSARKGKWSKSYFGLNQRLIQGGGELRKRSKEKTIAGPLFPLAHLRLSELDLCVITKWLEDEAPARQTQTRIAFESLRACLNWCAKHKDYKGLADPTMLSIATKKEYLAAKNSRDDCLQREQLAAFFAAARKYPSATRRAYYQVLLLTGARREEIAPLRWEDVDFRWNTMTLDGKTGVRTIPLTPYVRSLIEALPRKSEWVFSSPTAKCGYLTSPKKALDYIAARAEIEGLTVHGLRRSFATLSEWVEAPAGVIAKIQGHKPSSIAEKHYIKRSIDLLRLWHVKIEHWILEQAGLQQPEDDKFETGLRLVEGGKR